MRQALPKAAEQRDPQLSAKQQNRTGFLPDRRNAEPFLWPVSTLPNLRIRRGAYIPREDLILQAFDTITYGMCKQSLFCCTTDPYCVSHSYPFIAGCRADKPFLNRVCLRCCGTLYTAYNTAWSAFSIFAHTHRFLKGEIQDYQKNCKHSAERRTGAVHLHRRGNPGVRSRRPGETVGQRFNRLLPGRRIQGNGRHHRPAKNAGKTQSRFARRLHPVGLDPKILGLG